MAIECNNIPHLILHLARLDFVNLFGVVLQRLCVEHILQPECAGTLYMYMYMYSIYTSIHIFCSVHSLWHQHNHM